MNTPHDLEAALGAIGTRHWRQDGNLYLYEPACARRDAADRMRAADWAEGNPGD